MSELSIIQPGTKRKGFFTDTSVCIGCKACEVAFSTNATCRQVLAPSSSVLS
jgi:Fe-S-cluster-containing dehydrogenase component